MLKYAKITDEETKKCEIGTGINIEKYKFMGMTEMDVEEAYDGNWYVKGYAPKKPEPTYEEQRNKRANAFLLEADPLKYNYEEDSARYGATSIQAIESKTLWLNKKEEIRARYPYPEGAEE